EIGAMHFIPKEQQAFGKFGRAELVQRIFMGTWRIVNHEPHTAFFYTTVRQRKHIAEAVVRSSGFEEDGAASLRKLPDLDASSVGNRLIMLDISGSWELSKFLETRKQFRHDRQASMFGVCPARRDQNLLITGDVRAALRTSVGEQQI